MGTIQLHKHMHIYIYVYIYSLIHICAIIKFHIYTCMLHGHNTVTHTFNFHSTKMLKRTQSVRSGIITWRSTRTGMPYNSVLYQLFDMDQPTEWLLIWGTKIKIHRTCIESCEVHNNIDLMIPCIPTSLISWWWL